MGRGVQFAVIEVFALKDIKRQAGGGSRRQQAVSHAAMRWTSHPPCLLAKELPSTR